MDHQVANEIHGLLLRMRANADACASYVEQLEACHRESHPEDDICLGKIKEARRLLADNDQLRRRVHALVATML